MTKDKKLNIPTPDESEIKNIREGMGMLEESLKVIDKVHEQTQAEIDDLQRELKRIEADRLKLATLVDKLTALGYASIPRQEQKEHIPISGTLPKDN